MGCEPRSGSHPISHRGRGKPQAVRLLGNSSEGAGPARKDNAPMMWKDWITLTPEQQHQVFEAYKKAAQERTPDGSKKVS